MVLFCQTTSASVAHAVALSYVLYPVSAALAIVSGWILSPPTELVFTTRFEVRMWDVSNNTGETGQLGVSKVTWTTNFECVNNITEPRRAGHQAHRPLHGSNPDMRLTRRRGSNQPLSSGWLLLETGGVLEMHFCRPCTQISKLTVAAVLPTTRKGLHRGLQG